MQYDTARHGTSQRKINGTTRNGATDISETVQVVVTLLSGELLLNFHGKVDEIASSLVEIMHESEVQLLVGTERIPSNLDEIRSYLESLQRCSGGAGIQIQAVRSLGKWQYDRTRRPNNQARNWMSYVPAQQEQLHAAQAAGQTTVELSINLKKYEVNLHDFVQVRIETGQHRVMQLVTEDGKNILCSPHGLRGNYPVVIHRQ